MPPLTTTVDVTGRDGAAVPGYPVWPPKALPFEAQMFDVYRPDIASWINPGRSDLRAALPLRERDPGLAARIFAAQTVNTTRAEAPGVLAGLPRFVFAGVDAGLYATLDAPLTDYTVAILARASNLTGAKWLFGLGSTGTTRLGIYINGDDVAVQHGTGNVVSTAGTAVVVNAWVPLIVSFQNSDKAIRIHTGSITPALSATMVNAPPADLDMGIGSVPTTGLQPHTGEIALCALWRRAIHTDAAAMARLVAGLNGLAALSLP